MRVVLKKSNKPDKKYMVTIDDVKTIHFGASGYEDYTIHKDNTRLLRYNNRHKKRENWLKSGIKTAGFWSKWLLWNKPTITQSIKNIEQKFSIKISRK
jgi:hypothetical protein